MILIITHKQDFTADFVINKLNQQGIKYFRLNCEDINANCYSFANHNDFNFKIKNNEKFTSVWFRRTKLPEVRSKTEAEKLFLLGDYETLFENMFQLIDCKIWLSNPKFVYQAENKILQLKIAKDVGLKIPDTLITNSHTLFTEFSIKHFNNIIIKPIRQGRLLENDGHRSIFTNKIDAAKISNIRDFELTPSIFQEYVEKEYEIRVTVVGSKIFSARVNSQQNNQTKVDWRKEKIPFEKYTLPQNIEKKCHELLDKMNLSFGAIDFIRNKDGEYIFLEINPNGQWAWLEMESDLQISEAIINFLTEI